MSNLEEYVQFTLDYPKQNCTQCEENYDTDGIESDCESCGLPDLSSQDQEILDLYHEINSQFVYDFHALELVFEVHAIRCTRSEAKKLVRKLIMIHKLEGTRKPEREHG